MRKYPHYAIALALATLISAPLSAERLSIKPADIRDTWSYPSGALIINDRTLQPVSLRKAINPLTAATVRGVGAAQAQATNTIDGSRQTGWSPSSSDPESWWIEIDLGQVLPTQSLHLYFDQSQSPLAFFTVSLSKGERFINSANVVVDGTLLYSRSERFAFNDAYDLELELDDELVRIVRIEADRAPEGLPRLLEIEMEAFGDNIALDLINKGGSVDVEASIVALAGSPAVMFDGDLSTMWRVNPLAKGSSGGSETFGDYRVDLGATYRIDSVWFLGEPLGVPPRLRHFYANFLSYKILYSDGSLAPDGSLAWDEVVAIPSDQKNLFDKRNFRHEFAPILARYLRLFYPTSESGNIIGGGLSASSVRLDGLGLVSEFQAYGEGAPARVVLHSPVIDLGANWNITTLDWQAAIPSGARLLVRSRSGDQVVEENHYFDKNGKEVTQKRYEKLIVSFRGPIETNLQPGDGWSPWSEAYSTTGSLFRSPSPRRYFQLELELLSDEPQASVSLSELGVEYSRPLASTAIGEVQPTLVEAGQKTTFTYYLQPQMQNTSQGFQRILLEASIPLHFAELRRDGDVANTEVEETENGFRLHLDQNIRSDALIEVDFEATVFQNHTRFRTFLERDASGETTRQQVDPGDAINSIEGTGDSVTLPIDAALFSGLRVPAAFTPNGDGINDALSIEFDVLKILDPRPIEATIYDLQGRSVRSLRQELGLAGHYQLFWDGRNDSGALLSPGLYLLRLRVEGDSTTRTIARAVAISY
ncbi:MAG: hypothetical protein ACI906_000491 [Candidatus Latescibacterota bacterium]|jgi:hypothetical protein